MINIPVRTMLAIILENNLQMDDLIAITLSSETEEILGTYYDIEHMRTELEMIAGEPQKTLNLICDLIDVTEE